MEKNIYFIIKIKTLSYIDSSALKVRNSRSKEFKFYRLISKRLKRSICRFSI
ncbi:hypothetical protein [Arsenophonus endosymbiont of Bemisia tabaci]|uniref:hypothetical protein n=1 Tax=Arsenophonus endosymbiont of Bemisia tabaci TaxID=536059 RepID=UPI0015F38CF3|nr:hypothetical protein [Arsenophonus endosymbiont of Bemisia tabaci]